MLSASLAVALFAAFLAGCVSGMTGFGFALISSPLLLFVYDPTTVVALLPPAFVGVAVGVMVLRLVDPVFVRLGVGVVVILSTLLLLREIRLPGAKTWWGPVVAGTTSGALSTSTGLAGPLIVLLFTSRGLPKPPSEVQAPSAFS